MKTISIKYFTYGIMFIILVISLHCKKKFGNHGYAEFSPDYNQGSNQITKIVMANGGLNARDTPSLEGKVAFLIPKYTMIETTEEVGEEIEIKDKKGKWTKVQYGDKTGYVFGGYLFKAILFGSEKNPESDYYFTFYSINNPEPFDCRSEYREEGCYIVIYNTRNNQVLNAFPNMIVKGWIDKDHLATSWSIGDTGYYANGIKSKNIHTKEEEEIWTMHSQLKIEGIDDTKDTKKLCLKTFCFDLTKNPDVIAQIKTTEGLTYFEAGDYDESPNEYTTKISINEKEAILFLPNKNTVVH